MAVTFVIGNANRMPTSLFSPGTSIASVLANEFGEAEGLHFNTLFAWVSCCSVITFVVLALANC
jgi:phosphate transport system permease protein